MRYLRYTRVLLMLTFALSSVFVFGQTRGAQGIVVGQVVDQGTKIGLEYATVSVFSAIDSSLISGEVSDKKGQFIIKEIPEGSYYIKVNFKHL